MNNESEGPRRDDPEWEALARHLSGESSDAEAAEIERVLEGDPPRREDVRALASLLARVRVSPPDDLDTEGALARVKAGKRDGFVVPGARPARSATARVAFAGRWARGWRLGVGAIAAGVVLLVAATWLFRALVPAGPGEFPLEAVRWATSIGEIRELRLGDDTRVLLGPRSTLQAEAGYGVDHWSVALDGEGFFQVADASAGLFTVWAGDAVIRDLGTAFAVRAGELGRVEVIVTEGRVSLRRAADPPVGERVLRAGDRAVLSAEGDADVQPGTASGEDIAWTRGELVFRDAPMGRVAEDLRRWYGLELRMAEAALADRRLTASFRDDPPEQIARIVGLALGVEAGITGDTLVLGDRDTRP